MMMNGLFTLLAEQGFVTLLLVLGVGHLAGRLHHGFLSLGSTAGTLLVALIVGGMAFTCCGIRFSFPDLVGTIFLALFTYAIGLRVGPQCVEGIRQEGLQLVVLVLVTTTASAAIVYAGSRAAGLPPGYAAGILSGANTISAVMGVATAGVDDGLFQAARALPGAQVKANIAAGYSLTYLFSILGIVLLIRNLPGLFGIDPIAAARVSEAHYGQKGDPLPGTADTFRGTLLPLDVRVYRLERESIIGLPARAVFARFDTPIVRLTRHGRELALDTNPLLERGDLVTVFGDVTRLVHGADALGPEIADPAARRLAFDQAEIVVTRPQRTPWTLAALHDSRIATGLAFRALFREGHELPLLPETALRRHDVLRVVGPAESIRRLTAAVGQAVKPTDATSVVALSLGAAIGYLVGLITVPIAGIPIGLGAMGGVVVAGIVVAFIRTLNPLFGGPVPEPARAFLENIGVDLFVATLGLNVAPDLLRALGQGRETMAVVAIGIVAAVLPSFLSWVVGLYILRMDPIVLAGAVAGARNSTTAMRAISEQAHSAMPAFGYPVPYALSTIVFLVYGYLVMLLP